MGAQGSLFAFDNALGTERPTPAAPESPSAHLARVHEQIAALILDFLRMVQRRAVPEFHMAELTEYVARYVQTAPDSPGRVLRDLRARGLVAYVVVDRGASRYRVGA